MNCYKMAGGALGFYLVQNFKPGEIEPKLAHKLGCEWQLGDIP